MVQYVKTVVSTNLFNEKDINSTIVTKIEENALVAVVDHGCVWSKVIKDSYEGFCETRNLNFENKGEPNSDNDDAVTISIPRDCACALYDALKFSLKL